MEFSMQEFWSGLPSLPQGIFRTQRSNPGLLYCRHVLHCLSHQGSPKIKKKVGLNPSSSLFFVSSVFFFFFYYLLIWQCWALVLMGISNLHCGL